MYEKILEFTVAHAATIFGLGLVSMLIGILSLPYLVARIPEDYFSHHRRHVLPDGIRAWMIRMLKNLLGAVLLLAGLIMLFTPGQGLLTMLFGLMLMNYPGKYQLERWIISRPAVFKAVNFLRTRHGHPPLLPPLHPKSGNDSQA